MFVIGGHLKQYDWGGINGLAQWTGTPTDGPEAELWFGSHPSGPSPVLGHLGRDEPAFDSPLLMKILHVAKPLSIQVHPSLDAIARIKAQGHGAALADDGAKAEALIALGEFWALAGFREPQQAAQLLRLLGLYGLAPFAAQGNFRAVISALLALPHPPEWALALKALPTDEQAMLRAVLKHWSSSPATVVAFLLQPQVLHHGDCLYLPLGLIHAYVRGVGVEAMITSDNVLRLGLTGKALHPELALMALDNAAQAYCTRDGHRAAVTGFPFTLALLEDEHMRLSGPSVLMALRGTAATESRQGMLTAGHGQAIVVPADAKAAVTVHGAAAYACLQ